MQNLSYSMLYFIPIFVNHNIDRSEFFHIFPFFYKAISVSTENCNLQNIDNSQLPIKYVERILILHQLFLSFINLFKSMYLFIWTQRIYKNQCKIWLLFLIIHVFFFNLFHNSNNSYPINVFITFLKECHFYI